MYDHKVRLNIDYWDSVSKHLGATIRAYYDIYLHKWFLVIRKDNKVINHQLNHDKNSLPTSPEWMAEELEPLLHKN